MLNRSYCIVYVFHMYICTYVRVYSGNLSINLYKQETFICLKCHICVPNNL